MQCVQFLKLQKGLNHSTLLYITDQLPIWRSTNTITIDKTLKTIMVDAIRIYIHSTSSQINIKFNRFNHFLTIQYSVLLLQLRYVLYPTLSPKKKNEWPHKNRARHSWSYGVSLISKPHMYTNASAPAVTDSVFMLKFVLFLGQCSVDQVFTRV